TASRRVRPPAPHSALPICVAIRIRRPRAGAPLLRCAGRRAPRDPRSFPTRRSSDLLLTGWLKDQFLKSPPGLSVQRGHQRFPHRSEEHTSELQSRENIVCRLLLEKKNATIRTSMPRLRLQIGRANV